ncbi:MAG: hypothetical protein DYH15_14835 [Nitrosomonas sp. PRO4]|nr:hypothetical protein [Nitrosomonas sp. PRO4]
MDLFMASRFFKTNVLTMFFLCWLGVILTPYIYASRISYVYFERLPTAAIFLSTLDGFPLGDYIFDITYSFFKLLLFLLSCLSLGLRIIGGRAVDREKFLGRGAIAFLLGEIVYSYFFLGVIRIFQLPPWFVGFVYCIGFISGVPLLASYVQDVYKNAKINGDGKIENVIVLFSLVGLGIGLSLTSNRLGYDAAAEYFSQSKIMAETYSPIFFYPNNTILVSGFHPGILFTSLIQLFGDQTARMVSWLNGIIIVILGISISDSVGFTRRARVYYLVLMGTSTAFIDLLGDGKVELISTAPLMGALYLLTYNLWNPSRERNILIGVFFGYSIISRPYNIFLVPVFMISIILFEFFSGLQRKKHDMRIGIKTMLSYIWMLPTLLFSGAFFLWQNDAWLGSPLAPFEYSTAVLDTVDAWQFQFDPSLLSAARIFYPFTVTLLNTGQGLGNISPYFLGFLPFSLLYLSNKQWEILSSRFDYILASTVIVLVLWICLFYTVVEVRYVLFLWMILLIYCGRLMDLAMQFLPNWGRTIVNISLIGISIYMPSRTLAMSFEAYAPIQNDGQALCYGLDDCTYFNVVNEVALPGDRVFVLFAYRYYLRPDLFVCSSRVEDYSYFAHLRDENPTLFWSELYNEGYKYIVYEKHLSEKRYQFGRLPDLSTVPDWLHVEEIAVSEKGDNFVYSLDTRDPPFLPEKKCVKSRSGLWVITP